MKCRGKSPKRVAMAITAVMLAWLVLVPAGWAQQGPQSSRTSFGDLCEIRDTDAQSAAHLVRSGGKWSLVAAEQRPAAGHDMAARVWHDKNWMVDLRDTPAPTVPVVHTGQLCFDPQGRLTRMIDRYMELSKCRCTRFTSLTFARDGTVKQKEEQYVDEMSGTQIARPAAAKRLPGIWQYRRLDQLPFYSLLKK